MAKITPKRKGEWLVPAQSQMGTYRVIKGEHGFHCSCPDYELRGGTCKHGYAVEFFFRRETTPDSTVIETRAARVTYPENWAAYIPAQVSEKEQFCTLLRDLLDRRHLAGAVRASEVRFVSTYGGRLPSARMPDGSVRWQDRDWLSSAELVVLRTTDGATVTRRVTISRAAINGGAIAKAVIMR